MIKIKRETDATIGLLSESSMENAFLILIKNTCEKHSHHNIGRSFIKRPTSGASSDNEWQRVVQQVTTNGNERQQVTTNVWFTEWKQIRASKKKWFYVSKWNK